MTSRPRFGIIDLGSNSARLVIFEGRTRNPTPIFNEKAVLRLGEGLQATGQLSAEKIELALLILRRFGAIAKALDATPLEILATAAVRDATNGPDFISKLQAAIPDAVIRILSGQEEAAISSIGLRSGMPTARGLMLDIGGGSLELAHLAADTVVALQTLPLGVIRLAERSQGKLDAARQIVEAQLKTVAWLPDLAGAPLYLVGGSWRAFARIHMEEQNYPLKIVHGYAIAAQTVRDLSEAIISANRKVMDRMRILPRRRADDLPFAALILNTLVNAINPERVIFSAAGLREGWFTQQLPQQIQQQDPLLALVEELAARYSRDPAFPPAVMAWTDKLFAHETTFDRRLRHALCWVSDIGSYDHPEFRAEQAFQRIFRLPGTAIDHPTRAFLALGVALRYNAASDSPYLRDARQLLDVSLAKRAEVIGIALRAAYTLSGGARKLIDETSLEKTETELVLRMAGGHDVFIHEAFDRQLERLSQALGLAARITFSDENAIHEGVPPAR
jgi:exopolyphosphatase / guanosine-5'-triphosphate,3'-diphosphate pyrophosphatase